MSGTPGYLRWQPSEWLKVAVNMLPLLDKGETRLVALARSMRRCLGKDRHKPDEWIHRTSAQGNSQLNEYLQRARTMSEEERATHTVLTPAQQYALDNPEAPVKPRKVPAPRKRLDEGREYTGMVRWTTLERAKIVRMVKWFQEHGVKSSLGRMMVEAQELVLPADRRRAVAGLMQANHGGQNTRTFADGEANLWLLKDVPFNPPLPPRGESGEETGESPAVETAQEGPESVQIGPNATEPVHTPPETVSTPPIASGTVREGMSAGLQAFAVTMAGALDSLLMSHAALVIHTLDAKIQEQSTRMGAELAALIAKGLQSTVRGIMEQELGPLAAPAPAPAPASASQSATATPVYAPAPAPVPEPAAEAPKSRQLKVDVVGLNTPGLEQLVRQGFGPEVDLRFFDPDSAGSYAPHKGRECIMVTHRVPHALKDKIRAAKVEPLYVKATVGHIVHAIEELQRAQFIAGAAHHH